MALLVCYGPFSIPIYISRPLFGSNLILPITFYRSSEIDSAYSEPCLLFDLVISLSVCQSVETWLVHVIDVLLIVIGIILLCVCVCVFDEFRYACMMGEWVTVCLG